MHTSSDEEEDIPRYGAAWGDTPGSLGADGRDWLAKPDNGAIWGKLPNLDGTCFRDVFGTDLGASVFPHSNYSRDTYLVSTESTWGRCYSTR